MHSAVRGNPSVTCASFWRSCRALLTYGLGQHSERSPGCDQSLNTHLKEQTSMTPWWSPCAMQQWSWLSWCLACADASEAKASADKGKGWGWIRDSGKGQMESAHCQFQVPQRWGKQDCTETLQTTDWWRCRCRGLGRSVRAEMTLALVGDSSSPAFHQQRNIYLLKSIVSMLIQNFAVFIRF